MVLSHKTMAKTSSSMLPKFKDKSHKMAIKYNSKLAKAKKAHAPFKSKSQLSNFAEYFRQKTPKLVSGFFYGF